MHRGLQFTIEYSHKEMSQRQDITDLKVSDKQKWVCAKRENKKVCSQKTAE